MDDWVDDLPEQAILAVMAGACEDDRRTRDLTRTLLHAQLLAANPIQLGPVRWLSYDTHDPAQTRRLLATIDYLDTGVIEWIHDNPGCVLIVALVPVPTPPEARRN